MFTSHKTDTMISRFVDRKTGLILLGLQVVFIVAFALLASYGKSADVGYDGTEPLSGLEYSMFQDVQVMAFLGFGLLMAFPQRYMFSSVGFVLLVGTLAVQYGLICSAMLESLTIDNQRMFDAVTGAVVLMVSLGAIHGKVSILQQIILVLFETPVYTANRKIMRALQVADIGDGISVHLFGAYFGLAAAKVIGTPKTSRGEESSYISDVISIIGTLFLWIYWPSFNGYGYVTIDGQQRAVINTYLAITASCVTAFALSLLTNYENKLNMIHIQNATLAGAVAISSSADLMIGPWVASLVGMLGGFISVLGFAFVKPAVANRIGLHDTCGIHYLHGLPAVLSGLVAVVFALTASSDLYGSKLYEYFPARAPQQESLGEGRTAESQAGYQFLCILSTFIISTVSGVITGLVMRLCSDSDRMPFLDDVDWDVEGSEIHAKDRRTSRPLRSDDNVEVKSISLNM